MQSNPEKVLVATDLSPHSDRALDRAVSLARQIEAELHVVHAIEGEPVSGHRDELRREAERLISAYVRSARAGRGLAFSTHVTFGPGPEAIMRCAEEVKADIVVLGTHKPRTGDLLRHTTIARVLRESGRPVLLVTERPLAPYRKVMVAVDMSECSRAALEFALRLLPEAELTVVHAYEVPFATFISGEDSDRTVEAKHRENTERLVAGEVGAFLERYAGKAPSIRQVVARGMVREVVRKEAKRLRPELLVIGTHGRSGVAHALLGSVAEDLLRQPPCDILAVR